MLSYLKNIIRYINIKKQFIDSVVYFGANIDKKSTLGKHSVLFSNVVLQNSTLGDYSYMQSHSVAIDSDIGKFCSIASNITIGLVNHPTHLLSTSPVFYDNTQPLPFFFTDKKYYTDTIPRTIIEADVWIGQGAMIKAGITIGVGAVVGAGAVVTKNIEPYSVVVGVPAKHIKYRFEKELREKLIASQWWMLDEVKLLKLSPDFKNPEIMLEKLNEFGKYKNA
jgi:acetyltransferase-like isoleucine patch superfamily enzyme